MSALGQLSVVRWWPVLFLGTVLGLPPGGPAVPSPEYGWVRESLSNATINLGSHDFPDVKFNISDVLCHGVDLGPITTEPNGSTLTLWVHDSMGDCNAGWVHTGQANTTSGPFELNITVARVTAEVVLLKNVSGLVTGARLHGCDVDVLLNISFGPDESSLDKDVIEFIETHLTPGIGDAVCTLLDVAVAVELGGELQSLSTALEPFTTPIVPARPVPISNPSDAVDLRDVGVLQLLGFVSAVGLGPTNLDHVVDTLLPGGALQGDGLTGANVTVNVGNSTVLLGLVRYHLSGLDTFQTFSTLQAIGPQTLRADIALDKLVFEVTGYVEVQPDRGGPAAVQWFEAMLQVENITLSTTTELVVRRSRMDALHHRFASSACVTSTFSVWNTTFFDWNAEVSRALTVRLAGGNIDRDVDGLLDSVLELALATAEPVLPRVLRGVLNGPIRIALNNARATTMENAVCDVKPLQQDLGPRAVVGAAIGFTALLLFACAAVIGVSARRRQFEARATRQQCHEPNDGEATKFDAAEGVAVLTASQVLLGHRLSIMVALVGTLGIYAMGTASQGSAVNLEVEVDGSPVMHPPPLYYMSLVGSVRDAYRAHIYTLSIFIGVSNIAGPVIRIFVLFGISSVRTLPHKRRVAMASVANSFGRFVFAQAFLISMMMLAFRYDLSLSGKEAPVPAFAHVFIVPDWWGWWGIAICSATGILASNFILIALALVDPVWCNATPGSAQEGCATAAVEARRGSLLTTRSRPRQPLAVALERVVVIVLVAAAAFAIVYGSTLPAFQFHFEGVVRLLAEVTHSKSSSEYTFWSSLWALPSPRIGHAGGIAFIQGFKLITTFIMPLVQAMAIIVVWEVPMAADFRRWAGLGLQLVTSWAALDVLCLATTFAFSQIHLFAAFIVGDKCDWLEPLLDKPNVTQLLHGDPKCLDISVTIRPGVPVMGLAALVLHILAIRVGTKARRVAAQDRINHVDHCYSLHTPPVQIIGTAENAALLSSNDAIN